MTTTLATTLSPTETAALLAQLFTPTRGAMTEVVRTPHPSLLAVLAGADLRPTASTDMARIQMAHIIGKPIQYITLKEQAGRFVQLEYTPIQQRDPEFMLVLQNGKEANAFHRAVLNHIQARQTPMRLPSNGYVGCNHITPEQWYANVMQTVRDLAAPLYALNPTPLEAAFVLHWALLAAAEGRR